MKVPYHTGVGVGAQGRTQDVVSASHVRDPIAHGFVDCLLKCFAASLDAPNFSSTQAHAENVQGLSSHVFRPHVDHAFKTETSAYRSGCDPMLSGSSLGNDALLAHSLGKQGLAEGIVDLVGSGVQQVFPLEVNLCAAQAIAKPFRAIEFGRPAGKAAKHLIKLSLKFGILPCVKVCVVQFSQWVRKCFGDEGSAIRTEPARFVGQRKTIERSGGSVRVLCFLDHYKNRYFNILSCGFACYNTRNVRSIVLLP